MAGEILIMIPQYGELNRIYSDFIVSHTFSFDKQKFITNFYKQYNDTKAFKAESSLNWYLTSRKNSTLDSRQSKSRDREKHDALRKISIA